MHGSSRLLLSKSWLCMRVIYGPLHLKRTHTDRHGHVATLQCANMCYCADSCTVTPLGHLLYSPNIHFAELSCRSIYILSTIQSRAQKLRCQLSKIVPRSRLLQGSTRTNRGVGRVKRHRYECSLHGCDIV